MAHLFQVGVGSGGMAVLDALIHDPLLTRVTVVDPDVYQAHNVERHLFPLTDVGAPKAEVAMRWVAARRSDLQVDAIVSDLLDSAMADRVATQVRECDIGVCAADNEPAKLHFDALMRRAGKPWTLGEVLSGGIGGFVHWFRPGGPCYGCVASHLQRSVTVEKPQAMNYADPNATAEAARIPASKASIVATAGIHALVTLGLLANPSGYNPGFTSILLSLARVQDVFSEPFRPYRFRIERSASCLLCDAAMAALSVAAEDLDVAVDKALARLGNG